MKRLENGINVGLFLNVWTQKVRHPTLYIETKTWGSTALSLNIKTIFQPCNFLSIRYSLLATESKWLHRQILNTHTYMQIRSSNDLFTWILIHLEYVDLEIPQMTTTSYVYVRNAISYYKITSLSFTQHCPDWIMTTLLHLN